MTGPKTQNQYRSSSSKFISVKKKTVIRIYIIIGWLMIALTMMTATEVVSYDEIKYFFWVVPVSTAVLYLIYVNGKPYRMPKEEEIKSILALVFTFLCLIMAFFAAILLGH
ncbi:hypothetical protein [Methanosarcina sp. 1.H.A.2.2]|uniref:hypothetical protein n=2 Tax=unclassified Methanosarcina TaxID=2644672 RepID=UPI0006228BDC|nr:hypothetical protein [Methanosarcina sp. 1.H.A.2.2]KKH50400.1 hypothetical protein EO93_10140 [Methanosarcina sp. 1.H.A.2.2]